MNPRKHAPLARLIVAEALLIVFVAIAAAGNQAINSRHRYRFHEGTDAEVLLNNLSLTPGVVRTGDTNEVCNGGSTKQFRHTTEAMKRQVYAIYGVDKSRVLPGDSAPFAKPPYFEIDHLISLELGGADDVMNLWPQPYYQHPGAHEKDAVENYLHREVCAGRMSLTDAQKQIANDWYTVYLRMPKN